MISAIGRDVTERAVGERVFGITGGGAQAEYVAVPAAHCAVVPEHLDLVAMGGVPEVFVTAHDAMVTQAHVAAGEWVLVHAVGSGVGTAALQLAHELGAHVVGTARTADKLERCRALGLDAGIEPARTADGALDVDALAWAIVEATGGGAHVTLDLVGGDYVVADVNAATPKGRIVLIGTIAGGRANVPLMAILGKRLTVMGTVLRGRDVAEKAAAIDAFVRDVVPMLADGRVAPDRRTDLPARARDRRVRAARVGRDFRQGHPRLSLRSADRDDELVARRTGGLHRERPLRVETDDPGQHALEVAGLDDRLDVVGVPDRDTLGSRCTSGVPVSKS